jgi:hypothetical protein
MLRSYFLAVTTGLVLISASAGSAEPDGGGNLDLEPAMNGAVSARGLFPSQAMEEEFSRYLRWAKEQGLSRLVAFESLLANGGDMQASLGSRRMEEQFEAYLRWVEDQGHSPFYAFLVSDFD